MHVSKSLETKTGTVKFEGELSQEEADFVIKAGLNWLLQKGALPFITDTGGVVVDTEEYPEQ